MPRTTKPLNENERIAVQCHVAKHTQDRIATGDYVELPRLTVNRLLEDSAEREDMLTSRAASATTSALPEASSILHDAPQLRTSIDALAAVLTKSLDAADRAHREEAFGGAARFAIAKLRGVVYDVQSALTGKNVNMPSLDEINEVLADTVDLDGSKFGDAPERTTEPSRRCDVPECDRIAGPGRHGGVLLPPKFFCADHAAAYMRNELHPAHPPSGPDTSAVDCFVPGCAEHGRDRSAAAQERDDAVARTRETAKLECAAEEGRRYRDLLATINTLKSERMALRDSLAVAQRANCDLVTDVVRRGDERAAAERWLRELAAAVTSLPMKADALRIEQIADWAKSHWDDQIRVMGKLRDEALAELAQVSRALQETTQCLNTALADLSLEKETQLSALAEARRQLVARTSTLDAVTGERDLARESLQETIQTLNSREAELRYVNAERDVLLRAQKDLQRQVKIDVEMVRGEGYAEIAAVKRQLLDMASGAKTDKDHVDLLLESAEDLRAKWTASRDNGVALADALEQTEKARTRQERCVEDLRTTLRALIVAARPVLLNPPGSLADAMRAAEEILDEGRSV
jgi:hypothetical protein